MKSIAKRLIDVLTLRDYKLFYKNSYNYNSRIYNRLISNEIIIV